MTNANTKGRRRNAAQPLGERKGTSSKSATNAAAESERRSAGPDGPKAEAVSRTFKD
jgi:hypothetical protein